MTGMPGGCRVTITLPVPTLDITRPRDPAQPGQPVPDTKDFTRLHKPRNMLFQQQRPRSFSKNQFTIFHTKVSSHRKPAILFVFFPNLVVQQTASIISLMLYSRQQALQWLGALVAHLLPE